MSFIRKAAIVAATVASVGILGSGAAFADNTSACSSNDNGAGGDACLYFNSNLQGARDADPYANDYGTKYTFKAWSLGSNGAGLYVKNNTASVQNLDSNLPVTIWYNSGFQGPSQTIAANSWANLNSTLKNENASQSW